MCPLPSRVRQPRLRIDPQVDSESTDDTGIQHAAAVARQQSPILYVDESSVTKIKTTETFLVEADNVAKKVMRQSWDRNAVWTFP